MKNVEIKSINKNYLGKKKHNLLSKSKENPKIDDLNKESIFFEPSTELSIDNIISLDEKFEKIQGLDDVNIPAFLNDKAINNNLNKTIKKYYQAKKELASNELAKLYLIDINRLYTEKENI